MVTTPLTTKSATSALLIFLGPSYLNAPPTGYKCNRKTYNGDRCNHPSVKTLNMPLFLCGNANERIQNCCGEGIDGYRSTGGYCRPWIHPGRSNKLP